MDFVLLEENGVLGREEIVGDLGFLGQEGLFLLLS